MKPANAHTVKVAVVQAGSVPFDTDACVDKAVRLIGEAAATGAKVIVFPEAFITGYPKGLNYGLVVGARDPAGREEFRLYLDAAIEVPGPQTERLGEAAARTCQLRRHRRDRARTRHLLLHGALLRPGRPAARQAPQAHADRDGTDDLGLRRRLDADGGGQSVRPHRLGDLLGELHADAAHGDVFEERRALLRADRGRSRHLAASMQHVALEGRCFVLTACQVLPQEDFPATVRVSLGDSPDAVLMRGGSAIISPLGKVLAGPASTSETILTASLDLDDIGRGKFDFDVAGHYSRPDVFQLIVNEAPARPVVTKE